jgi:GAF domain-containing protein
MYRESGGCAMLAASAGPDAFPEELQAEQTLPIGIGSKRYGEIVLREDPAKEAFASDELALLRDLSRQLAAAIAVLRADKYEQLLIGTS